MVSRQDWLLIFIGLPSGRFPTDQIRIMKGLFLFSQEGPSAVSELYAFEPYAYGPFDTQVYHDLDDLEAAGLVLSETVSGSNRRIYNLSTRGFERAQEIQSVAPADALEVLRQIKLLVTSLTFLDLLKDVYKRYPQYAVKSVAHL